MNQLLTATIQKQTPADIAKRMVWGIATSETPGPDHQNDIVDFNGSVRAFKRWERNVREMHTNKAVGRCVSVVPLPNEKKILVGIRVSEGAPDTWAKVRDGTLAAFSIGGFPVKEHKKWNESAGRFVNYITDYRLTELSLVDSPANPECRVTLLTKRNGQKLASDVLAEQGDTMDTQTQEAARTKFTGFAKSLEDGDELVMIRKSDLLEGENGAVGLKPDAPVETLSKAEAEAGVVPNLDEGQDEGQDEDEGGEDVDADLNAIAESLLEAHDVLHDLAGQGCSCNGDGEGGDEQGDHELPESGEDEVDKTLHSRWRKRMALRKGFTVKNGTMQPKKKKLTKKRVKKMLAKAIGARTDALAKSIDAIAAKVGVQTVQPMLRKGDEATPIAKNGKTAGALVKANDAVSGDEEAVTQLAQHVRDLRKETHTLLQKRDSGTTLTSEEQVRLSVIDMDLSRAKIAYQAATGRAPSEIYAEAS